MDEDRVGALIPKWAEEKAERGVATGERAVELLEQIATDWQRYVDHIVGMTPPDPVVIDIDKE